MVVEQVARSTLVNSPFGWRRHTIRIALICTVFNRRPQTLKALMSLASQRGMGNRFSVEVFVFDDASTDGTAAALQDAYPRGLHVETGLGESYWARGMARAQLAAVVHDPDFVLWINDDVSLEPNAIDRLLDVSTASKPSSIAVGAMVDPNDGHVIYSGTRLRNRRPGSLEVVEPADSPLPIDSFHGNLVLVPRSAYQRLGTIDPAFAHAYGDNDYGLRARRHGIRVLLAPGTFGHCERNEFDQVWMSGQGSRRWRTRQLFGRKGLPLRSHLRYNVRHGGASGLVYASASYAKALKAIWLR